MCFSIIGQANLPDDDHGDEEAKLFQETTRRDKSQKIQKFQQQWFVSLLFTITISHTISLLSKDSELDRMSAKQLRCWLKDQGVRTSGYEVAVDTKLSIF